MRAVSTGIALLLLALLLQKQTLAADPGSAGGSPSPTCSSITDPEARLRCYDRLTTPAAPPKQSDSLDNQSTGRWRLVRTPGPEGHESVSMLRPADTLRSDPGLAGLALHCGKKGAEMLIIVVEPFRPRSHPKVKIDAAEKTALFDASVLPSGAILQLPNGAIDLAKSQQQSEPALTIELQDDKTKIRGVVPIDGLDAALHSLGANCLAP